MLSRLVADREQSARYVAAAFETHGKTAARLVMELLSEGAPPGEPAPDVDRFIAHLHRRLDRARLALTEADQAHSRELGDDVPVREARDVAKASVLSLITNIRLALTSQFGQDFGGRLGAFGPAPESPSDVLSWGKKVEGALAALSLPEADPEADNDEVGTFSKETALRKLRQRLDQLDQALVAVAREGREAEATQAQKDRAIAAYDRTFSLTAGLLEVLLRFAGEGELANKVRPSTRRPGTTAQAELTDPTDPTGPTTPADPSSPAT